MMRLLMLSKGLARYRYSFTEQLGEVLRGRMEVVAAPLGEDLWEVDYPALKRREGGAVRYVDFPRSWAELDALEADVLCTMEYAPAMLLAQAWARWRGRPVVVSTEVGRGEPVQHEVRWYTRLLHEVLGCFSEGQLAFSPAARLPFCEERREVLFAPHSIDTREFVAREWAASGEGAASTRLLTVAQYHPRKGLDLMAAALQPLVGKVPFQWRIVGILDPSWLQGVIAKHGLQDHAVVTGPIQGEGLIAEFQQADGFVLPSRFDTYGVVTQEAGACGLPLLISRFAGSSENLVRDGVNGWRFDPHDRERFTMLLHELITLPLKKRGVMGAASRERAEEWCVRKNAQRAAEWFLGFTAQSKI